MSKKLHLSLIALVILAIALITGMTLYYDNLPDRVSQHETIVLGQTTLVPGSQAAMRVVVRDTKDASPLPNADISVQLTDADTGAVTAVFSGKTGEAGTSDVVFRIPEETGPNQMLTITTASSLGSDTVERNVTIRRDYRVLLSTDKPLYQPGQEIHLRALALGTFDLAPAADQPLEIVIADGKGNKVYRDSLTTNKYGVAFVDFQLASQVNTGAYKITATLGETTSEKTVAVENYQLPKFDIAIETEKPFYLPGERVEGMVSAQYFFGKPVAGGTVEIAGYTFDVERVDAVSLELTTDENGFAEFTFDLPSFIAGTEFNQGLGRFYLQTSVTDLAKQTEIKDTSLPVAGSAIQIEAIPEGGQFRPGVENIFYVFTSYPDGSPAETTVDVNFYDEGVRKQVETGPFGIAEIPYTPNSPYNSVAISAQDATGASAYTELWFDGVWQEEYVLLRPEKPIYRVGETMSLTVFTQAQTGTVYFDIIREGQTISTRAVDLQDGTAQITVDLSPDLYGTLELHAYKILSSGDIARDTRLVVVDQASDLSLSLTPGADTYRPGETATLDIGVTGADGAGAQSAVGLAIVDESVFALAEQDPGFAKLYFLLEEELLQPKYDLHGFSIPDMVEGLPISAQPTVDAIEKAGTASLAAASPTGNAFSLSANSHDDAVRNVRERQTAFFAGLSVWMYGFLLVIPVVVLGMSVWAVRGTSGVWRGLGQVFVGLLAFVGLISLWPHPWARSPLDKIGVFFDFLLYRAEWLLIAFLLLMLVAFITLIVIAIRKHDALLGWMLGLYPLFGAVLLLTAYASEEGNAYPDEWVLILGLLAFLLMPLAYLLRATGFGREKRRVAMVTMGLLGVFVVVVTLPFASAVSSMSRSFAGGDMFIEEMVEVEMDVAEMAMDMAFAPEEPNAAILEKEAGASLGVDDGVTAGAEPPRLRQYFPETMLWLPDVETDVNGQVTLDFPVADSITTWRMTALASTQDGRLGSATGALRVFQDFFIDLDLPTSLTVGDEIAVPVGVFNYLTEAQSVRLELQPEPWFELLDEAEKTIEIAPNDITVVYFRVRALEFGRQPFQVTAWGSQMSDAIRKDVRVYPNGKEIRFTQSDRLTPDAPAIYNAIIPADAIPGTQGLTVKIYPGIVSQVVEGLDSMLRMPYGCFEQTSSTTYPNVLVLDYLKTTQQASPETQFKAEEYINLGYQRLTTFEVSSTGGFSLFGDPPPDRMLTAYGLQEFSDMSRVHNVDPDLVRRAAEWIFVEQLADGSWENDQGLVHENTWANLKDDRLPVTAYIVWSLVDAGFYDDARTQNGIAYVRENAANAEDAYVLALVANALVSADRAEGTLTSSTQAVLDRLVGFAQQENGGATWGSGVATFIGSTGQTGSIETTALAALALIRADAYPDMANAALTALIRQKDSFGTWYSTQSTVLTLKALIESVRSGAENVNATVKITLNDGQTRSLTVTPDNFDVVQMVTFDDINVGRDNIVDITVEGEGSLMYQVSGNYYLPWDLLTAYPDLVPVDDLLTIDVNYDRTELAVDETVQVDVSVTMAEGRADWALIDLGIPPGFTVETADLSARINRDSDRAEGDASPVLKRFELTGRQILVYIGNMSVDQPLEFSYQLRAKFPLTAQTPASTAYDYYNPDVSGEDTPQILVVTE